MFFFLIVSDIPKYAWQLAMQKRTDKLYDFHAFFWIVRHLFEIFRHIFWYFKATLFGSQAYYFQYKMESKCTDWGGFKVFTGIFELSHFNYN